MRFKLSSPRASYDLEYSAKVTIIGGDSGAGKSYLCEQALYAHLNYRSSQTRS